MDEICEQLARYIGGEATLDEFADWFVPQVLHLDEYARQYPALAEFAAQIDLLLIEYSDEYWTEDELRGLLAPFTTEPSVSTRA